jgi:hypothetical protein
LLLSKMGEKIIPINNGYGDALFQMGRGNGEYGIALFCRGPGGSEGAIHVRVETTAQGYNVHLSTHDGGEVSACKSVLEIETDKEFNKLTIRKE